MVQQLQDSFLKALFWFVGNFIYGLIPLAIVAINSSQKFIRFVDDGYLVFLAAALVGSIGIDVFLFKEKISGFATAFINICGYCIIVYTSIVYLIQSDKESGFNQIPVFQVIIILFSIAFCIFVKTVLNFKEHSK